MIASIRCHMTKEPHSSSFSATTDEYGSTENRCKAIALKTLKSTQHMRELCEQSRNAALETLVRLDYQAEQINNVESSIDSIHTDLQQADKNLRGMEKCCGLCVLPWCSSQCEFENNTEYQKAWKEDDKGVVFDQPRLPQFEPIVSANGEYVTKITGETLELEMDENLNEVVHMVGTLMHMACDISVELSSQNQQLGRLVNKTSSDQQRVSAATARANSLINTGST